MVPRSAAVVGLVLLLALALHAQEPASSPSLERWRADHEAALRSSDGWLSVVGLAWLKAGANRAGSAAGADVQLPAGTPATVGTFRLAAGVVTFEPTPGVDVATSRARGAGGVIRPDVDRVSSGSLTLLVIKRGDRVGVRIKDSRSASREQFAGEIWYPGNDAWRVTARFERYDPPKLIPILNVIGQVEPQPSPGALVFALAGREFRLDPIEQDGRLFVIFKDSTSGETTYPSGRFLYASMPANGQVLLDFNKAENPPCAFTEFATCPLPPRQNQLPIRVEAGEKYSPHKRPSKRPLSGPAAVRMRTGSGWKNASGVITPSFLKTIPFFIAI